MQTIQLDCPPGLTRPDDLIGRVIEDTGLEVKEPVSKWFGEWTWDYSEVPEETWEKAQPILEKRIKEFYHIGLIRYGSW